MDIKIQGHNDAMPGENILLNISVQNPKIHDFTLNLSESLHLDRVLNYDLKKDAFNKKTIEFKVSQFQLKNNLALILKSRLPKRLKRTYISVDYILDNEPKQIKYYIKILKPHIKVILNHQRKNQLSLKIIKKEPYLPTKIDKINFKAFDIITGDPLELKIERYTFEEFFKNITRFPKFLTEETAIKRITINTETPVKFKVWIEYSDRQDTNYISNSASIIISPVAIAEGKSIVQTTPNYIAEGFDYLLEPLVIA